MRIFSSIIRICSIIYILAKYEILIYKNIKPFPLRLLCRILSALFYPKCIFISNGEVFGKNLLDCISALGPIYIKFGQNLSIRPDIIGVFAEHLKDLQDKLPPFDKEIVYQAIRKNFGKDVDDIFEYFSEEAVSAASIAQVHKAKLKSGENVAVKILRPNIKEIYQRDIYLLEFLTKILEFFYPKINRLKPREVVERFKESMNIELDLQMEAAIASRIYHNNDDSNIIIPRIFWELTSNEILTSQWIDGFSIYDKSAIKKFHLDPKKLLQNFAVAFFNQAYRDGFFHADLHPGNIIICKDGRIGLVDFGIFGVLPERDRIAMGEILYGICNNDYLLVAKVHMRAGYIPKDSNINKFALRCRSVAEPIIQNNLANISIAKLLSRLFEITAEFGMQVQPQLLLMQKTLLVVEGIGRNLCSDANMWQLAQPWIEKWAIKNLSFDAKLVRFIKNKFEEFVDGNNLL